MVNYMLILFFIGYLDNTNKWIISFSILETEMEDHDRPARISRNGTIE